MDGPQRETHASDEVSALERLLRTRVDLSDGRTALSIDARKHPSLKLRSQRQPNGPVNKYINSFLHVYPRKLNQRSPDETASPNSQADIQPGDHNGQAIMKALAPAPPIQLPHDRKRRARMRESNCPSGSVYRNATGSGVGSTLLVIPRLLCCSAR